MKISVFKLKKPLLTHVYFLIFTIVQPFEYTIFWYFSANPTRPHHSRKIHIKGMRSVRHPQLLIGHGEPHHINEPLRLTKLICWWIAHNVLQTLRKQLVFSHELGHPLPSTRSIKWQPYLAWIPDFSQSVINIMHSDTIDLTPRFICFTSYSPVPTIHDRWTSEV